MEITITGYNRSNGKSARDLPHKYPPVPELLFSLSLRKTGLLYEKVFIYPVSPPKAAVVVKKNKTPSLF